MGRPQQPELARSGRTDLDPDSIGTELESRKPPRTKGRTGPVPPGNQPRHHPEQEADQPDLDAFAERLSGGDPADPPDASPPEASSDRTPPAMRPDPGSRRQPAVVGLALGGARVGVRLAIRGLQALEARLSR